ncbi:DUF4468 domain-containing protein [Pedobacter fastidiosus]|uniref:DUF4468 domain-containing protein n=1 Tax=Pedobacter fastidiosus TaxID=2765361 RepID=A0ABR7KP55_9SPHI|nr:DUF4468 domain-containing protein [Pedobacter fastidiosus]MBC6109537.1 DUF4468 domain-containing protein [Pedobacter fastidiosus]
MKKYLVLIIFLATFIRLSAQQKQLPLDDRGKYIYYEVVDTKTVNKDSLLQRAEFFINKVYKKSMKQESSTDSSVLASGTLVIDKTLLVAGHPSGEVKYNFTVEIRSGKYRFWLTDFEYIPYQRDRYGNFVATTNIGTPLEKAPGKLNSGQWKDILGGVSVKATKFGEDFKKVLATSRSEKAKKKEETISTKKW